MPKRTDIQKILVIGSGPIVIGQACEFDYSGTQACKALREEGYQVVLVNSNPATIMTDPDVANATYIEPLTVPFLEKIIAKEKPQAVLPTLGGQTALNLAMALNEEGIFQKYQVEMLGVSPHIIQKAEDRHLFKETMQKIGMDLPKSEAAYTIDEARKIATKIGFPCIIRASFTLGGTGGGIAYNVDELDQIAKIGLERSVISEILIEESIVGWKEYEMEVMRDKADNVVIVCSIENIDPMGIHTGDSMTVAPAQTLSDTDYQRMRNASLKIIREIGVETGGSNIQFAVNPQNGRMVVIEMNPRVSRSSALASKATGFPIAKLAAKLAVGYTLDEVQNDITKKTPACFEPVLDYVVVKIPRFNFDKFPKSDPTLGISMKSVGEAMAIGRTFKEAFQKALRSLETKRMGFGFDGQDDLLIDDRTLIHALSTPGPNRIFYIHYALKKGMSIQDLYAYTGIDPWFLYQFQEIVKIASEISTDIFSDEQRFFEIKQKGFSDLQLSVLTGLSTQEIKDIRVKQNLFPVYKLVDTCAAEFESFTPYFYSSYDQENEVQVGSKKKVMILGGGPNRIGQGIEFDYCCVHASFCLRELGYESIMVNSNPETVSTDFDTSDKLYFEPLTFEDVMNIYEFEKPEGVIVQFGGQTPINLVKQLHAAGVSILGTSPENIDLSEDRKLFQVLLKKLGLNQPENGTAVTVEEAITIANHVGYPVVVRPSYVLGGASMRIVYTDDDLIQYVQKAKQVSPSHPILIDHYLENAIEVDVDAVADGKDCVIAGIMEHIEEAGIHSGDSACSLPAYSLSQAHIDEIRRASKMLAIGLDIKGSINIQFAIKDDILYVLEVNPRASRTLPFVSKTTGMAWAKISTKLMLGYSLKSLEITEVVPKHFAVKEAVFPFKRFPGEDILLGPEMKSTGEVMGIDQSFPMAYLKAQLACGQEVPQKGKVFVSVKDSDKHRIIPYVKKLLDLGFEISSTRGTYQILMSYQIPSVCIQKVAEGRPNVLDHIINDQIDMVFTTGTGKNYYEEEVLLRQAALQKNIITVTTVPGMSAMVQAIEMRQKQAFDVKSLQSFQTVLVND